MADKVYSEREIRALIERAAALQAEAERVPESGLSLAELEHVAHAAGIDPVFLRKAAAEVRTGRPPVAARTDDGATQLVVEHVVPGPFAPDAWEDVVMALRQRFDTSLGASMGMPGYGQGTTEQIGRSSEWRHTSMSGIETRVLVRPRDGQMQLRLSQHEWIMSTITESVLYAAILALVGGIVPGVLVGAFWAYLLGVVAVLAVAVPLVHAANTRRRTKKHRALEALADEVAQTLAAGAQTLAASGGAVTPSALPTTAASPTPASAARLDPALLASDETTATEEPDAPVRPRTRA